MKKTLARDNPRTLKPATRQPNPVQSQSPPQTQLIKKIQLNPQGPSHKSDLSLQENLLLKPQQEEVVDFRVEIERRFDNSFANKLYTFPLKRCTYSDEGEESQGSLNSSLESLKHVTTYDLNSQNNKKKRNIPREESFPEFKSNLAKHKTRKSYNIMTDGSDNAKTYQLEPTKANENHKSPPVYKKLFTLLEKQSQLRLSSTKCATSNPYNINQLQEKFKSLLTQRHPSSKGKSASGQHNLKNKPSQKALQTSVANSAQVSQSKETTQKSQERHIDQNSYRINEEYSGSLSTQTYNKTLSREQGRSIDTSSGGLEKSFRNVLSPLNKEIISNENKKFKQESLKRIYSNNLLKTTTTHCPKNVIRAKNNENCPPSQQAMLHNLYQKAQNGILSNKVKVKTDTINKQNSATNLVSPTQREETPKNFAKNVNLLNFYGSPSTLTTIHSSQSKLSKKNSLKPTSIVSPAEKKKEKPLFVSHDLTSDLASKKHPFKLNLSKRSQESREVLTSGRKRSKLPVDKLLDVLNNDMAVRGSYELSQYNSFGNTSGDKQEMRKTAGLISSNSTTKVVGSSKGVTHLK